MSVVTEPKLTFTGYFKNIWTAIRTTFKGMMITFKYVYGVKPVTVEYPEVKEVLPENSRSRLYNDVENCISCMQCATACPVDCIYIAAVKRDKDAPKLQNNFWKSNQTRPYSIHNRYSSLLLLWSMYNSLPDRVFTHTTDYEFAQFTLDEMKYDYLASDVRAWRTRVVKRRIIN